MNIVPQNKQVASLSTSPNPVADTLSRFVAVLLWGKLGFSVRVHLLPLSRPVPYPRHYAVRRSLCGRVAGEGSAVLINPLVALWESPARHWLCRACAASVLFVIRGQSLRAELRHSNPQFWQLSLFGDSDV